MPQDADTDMREVSQNPSLEDEEMHEAEEFEEEEEEEVQRVRLLPGSTATAASFEMLDETHTLGNALRYVVSKNPEVEFCAYAVPHPSESRITVRIQTYEGTTAFEALQKGLKDVQDLCDVVVEKFWTAREVFGCGTPTD